MLSSRCTRHPLLILMGCMCKMQNNRLSGTLGVSNGFNHLSIAYIQNNTFNLSATLAAVIAGGHVTDLDAANNV